MNALHDALKPAPLPAPVYSAFLANQLRRLLTENSVAVDQSQSNGVWCCHQLRVTLPEGLGTYRVLVCPENAPVSIGGVPVDEHFAKPLTPNTTPPGAA